MPNTPTLATLADDLDCGRTSARKLVDECLAKIADTSGEGARAFIHVDAEAAIEAAEAMDRLREVKAAPSRFAGIPVSIKDLFDIKGQVTRAGSRALDDSPPAEADAPAVARLRRAGFVVIGRTNMTEFAYSGIGINPHYGTPKGAWQRSVGHVPGGSSSGAAVSVVDGMAHGALGTDTGGSCRIPAAYNGIVGFKPTQRRVPLDGAVPLSFTLDSIGPLARSVACCATLDAVLANETARSAAAAPDQGHAAGGADHGGARRSRRCGGADIRARAGDAVAPGRADRADRGAGIPRCRADERQGRFRRGGKLCLASLSDRQQGRCLRSPGARCASCAAKAMSAADYVDLVGARKSLIARATARLAPYDAMVMPTTANTPPRIADLADDKAFTKANLLVAAQLHADQHDRRLRHLAALRIARARCRSG